MILMTIALQLPDPQELFRRSIHDIENVIFLSDRLLRSVSGRQSVPIKLLHGAFFPIRRNPRRRGESLACKLARQGSLNRRINFLCDFYIFFNGLLVSMETVPFPAVLAFLTGISRIKRRETVCAESRVWLSQISHLFSFVHLVNSNYFLR